MEKCKFFFYMCTSAPNIVHTEVVEIPMKYTKKKTSVSIILS